MVTSPRVEGVTTQAKTVLADAASAAGTVVGDGANDAAGLTVNDVQREGDEATADVRDKPTTTTKGPPLWEEPPSPSVNVTLVNNDSSPDTDPEVELALPARSTMRRVYSKGPAGVPAGTTNGNQRMDCGEVAPVGYVALITAGASPGVEFVNNVNVVVVCNGSLAFATIVTVAPTAARDGPIKDNPFNVGGTGSMRTSLACTDSTARFPARSTIVTTMVKEDAGSDAVIVCENRADVVVASVNTGDSTTVCGAPNNASDANAMDLLKFANSVSVWPTFNVSAFVETGRIKPGTVESYVIVNGAELRIAGNTDDELPGWDPGMDTTSVPDTEPGVNTVTDNVYTDPDPASDLDTDKDEGTTTLKSDALRPLTGAVNVATKLRMELFVNEALEPRSQVNTATGGAYCTTNEEVDAKFLGTTDPAASGSDTDTLPGDTGGNNTSDST
jgi:hypothetical protein